MGGANPPNKGSGIPESLGAHESTNSKGGSDHSSGDYCIFFPEEQPQRQELAAKLEIQYTNKG